MYVFEGLLHGWQVRTGSLAFPRIRLSIGVLPIIVSATRAVYFIPCLIFQKALEEVAKRVATKPPRLVVPRPLDLRIILQDVRYSGKNITGDAVDRQILEQK